MTAGAPGRPPRSTPARAPRDGHDQTVEVYQTRAVEWAERRTFRTEAAEEFTRAVAAAGTDGPVVDLGCGPGWHLPSLPDGTIALDATPAMLDLVPRHLPGAPRVLADLRGLPFARHALGGAWADRSYVHLHREQVPMALWDLHRCVQVGGLVRLVFFAGDDDHARYRDDDFPGRWFSHWPETLLADVLEGAGFDVERLVAAPHGNDDHIEVWMRRARTLADTVGPGMRLLLVGLNPSLVAADAGVGFHRNGNRAWPALRAAGLASADRDARHLLVRDGIGMTDLVKRASPAPTSSPATSSATAWSDSTGSAAGCARPRCASWASRVGALRSTAAPRSASRIDASAGDRCT